jgi:regulator of sirC expression with transglutaminase-like and TPR domain
MSRTKPSAPRLGLNRVNSCSAPLPASDGTACAPAPPAERDRLGALIALMADDSPLVWEKVRQELLLGGRRAEHALRRAARSSEARTRSRARTLLSEAERRRVARRLVRFASRESIDLEQALFLLARYAEPELDPRPYQRQLDSLAAELLERGRHISSEIERARLLPRYLGTELGFGGSQGDFHQPDNIHLHRVLERKQGLPLSLSAVYLFVARRMGMRAAILPLPGHVMLRLHTRDRGLIIDPYHKGQERTERDCRHYLNQIGTEFNPLFLRDAGDRVLFKRQVLNLSRSAEKRGLKREVQDLALVIHALDPKSAASLAARGLTRGRER